MTARFLASYETPADPEAFDRHYRGAEYYLVAEPAWDTMDELQAAFASPVGRATAVDAARLQELASVRSIIFTLDERVR
jgi:hypothetical protein